MYIEELFFEVYKKIKDREISHPRIEDWECNMHGEKLLNADVVSSIIQVFNFAVSKAMHVNYTDQVK